MVLDSASSALSRCCSWLNAASFSSSQLVQAVEFTPSGLILVMHQAVELVDLLLPNGIGFSQFGIESLLFLVERSLLFFQQLVQAVEFTPSGLILVMHQAVELVDFLLPGAIDGGQFFSESLLFIVERSLFSSSSWFRLSSSLRAD